MYRLLIECFTKYCVIREAIRHFRALKFFEGGTKVLHNEGNFGDPLSLYLRALCREGIHIFHLSFQTRVSNFFYYCSHSQYKDFSKWDDFFYNFFFCIY